MIEFPAFGPGLLQKGVGRRGYISTVIFILNSQVDSPWLLQVGGGGGPLHFSYERKPGNYCIPRAALLIILPALFVVALGSSRGQFHRYARNIII